MRVIFLDIDGVLCNYFHWDREIIFNGKGVYTFDINSVNVLNDIIEKTNAKIVISSTWRHMGIEFLREFFKNQGVKGEIIDITSWNHSSKRVERGIEIQTWLDKNQVDKFAILDDNSDMVHLKPFLIQTFNKDEKEYSKQMGLKQEHIDKVIKILGV